MDQVRHEAELVMLPLASHRELKMPGLALLLHRWELQAHQDKIKIQSVTLESNLFPCNVISRCPFPLSVSPEEQHSTSFYRE